MIELILLVLLGFILLAAFVAVETRDLFSAVMCLSAAGFGLAIVFLILQAPELVAAQVLVEILCLVMMIITVSKSSRYDRTKHYTFREMNPSVVAIVFFSIIFLMFCIPAINSLPQFGAPLMKVANLHINEVLKEIGATNIVTAILLDFRAYNTLIEALVIVTMVVGVAVIMRKTGRIKKK